MIIMLHDHNEIGCHHLIFMILFLLALQKTLKHWSNQRTSLLKSSNYFLIITVQVHPLSLEIATPSGVVKPPAPFCLGAQRLSHYVELSAQGDDDLVDFSI